MRWPARSGLLRVLAVLWLGLATLAGAWAAPASAPPAGTVVLRDAAGAIDAGALARVWLDPSGQARIADVASRAGLARFRPAEPGRIHKLGPEAALWMHLRLVRAAGGRQDWMLEFPMTLLDHVTVYQREGNGWRAESAGDTLAVADWPVAGRYPAFRLDLPPGEARDVLVRIRHVTAADFPVRLTTALQHAQQAQRAYVALGTAFGALLLLVAICLAQAWVYRDRVYVWYAGYAALVTLTAATYTGAAQHLLWPGFIALGDATVPMLSAAATAAALLFVGKLLGGAMHRRIVGRLVCACAWAGFAVALLPVLASKLVAVPAVASYVIAASLASIALAVAAWRRGDVVGGWVFAAFLPLVATTAMGVLRLYGWLPVSFATQYAVVPAMVAGVPIVLVALGIRSRERHGAAIREQALATQDALTGLLASHLFHDRLHQVVARYRRHRASAAVLFIDLVNYPRIKEVYGTAVAEQSLLRSVIKLRRLLRDVDTVSRVGEARFGVILEGIATRPPVTDRAARLIASGLMPLPGLKPEVTLQFHIAAVLLDEHPMEAPDIVDSLSQLLAGMSPRTRRPIRFVPPQDTQPAPLEQDSSILPDEEEARPRAARPPLAAVR